MRPEVLTLLAVLAAAPAMATPPASFESITVETTKKVAEPMPDPAAVQRQRLGSQTEPVAPVITGISNSAMPIWVLEILSRLLAFG